MFKVYEGDIHSIDTVFPQYIGTLVHTADSMEEAESYVAEHEDRANDFGYLLRIEEEN